MKIAIVVPAYNEQKKVSSVFSELQNLPYPVFAVDDGSKDKTYSILSNYQINILKHRIQFMKAYLLMKVVNGLHQNYQRKMAILRQFNILLKS